jgi:hypothetical protein
MSDIFGKIFKKSQQSQKIKDQTGWGGWLDTKAGKDWEEIGVFVYDKLEKAKADPGSRLIIFEDGSQHSVTGATQDLATELGRDRKAVHEHILLWLEEASDPLDDDVDDEEFADEIQTWIDEEERA